MQLYHVKPHTTHHMYVCIVYTTSFLAKQKKIPNDKQPNIRNSSEHKKNRIKCSHEYQCKSYFAIQQNWWYDLSFWFAILNRLMFIFTFVIWLYNDWTISKLFHSYEMCLCMCSSHHPTAVRHVTDNSTFAIVIRIDAASYGRVCALAFSSPRVIYKCILCMCETSFDAN